MKQLDKDWLTSGLIDFEYKKYILLAYLQEVKGNFDSVRLYPYLSDLVFHYQNLLTLKKNKELIYENFPKKISKADFEKLRIQYKKVVADDDIMSELEEILHFALPQVQTMLQEGKDLFDFVEEHLEISPIGISPLRFEEGYLFLDEKNVRETYIYQYQLTVFENAHETFRAIHVIFLETVLKSIGKTFENMKLDLIRKYQKFPNPAAYLVYSQLSFPLQETLLPVAKRLLVKYVASGN